MQDLGLKFQEHRHPAGFIREMDKEAAVRINTIVFGKTSGISLVHMNIMNALAGSEVKICVGFFFRRPLAAEAKKGGAFLPKGFSHPTIEESLEAVVRSLGGSRRHLRC